MTLQIQNGPPSTFPELFHPPKIHFAVTSKWVIGAGGLCRPADAQSRGLKSWFLKHKKADLCIFIARERHKRVQP